MAISSIQPIMSFNISGFSAVMQATATSPPQLLSVTTQTVTTPTASTVVTLGTVQPLSQPLFDASGRLTGGTATSGDGTGTATAGNVGRLIDANLALAGSASPDLTAVDATGVGAASLLSSPTGTTGSLLNRSLAADVQTAVAGIDATGGPRTGPSTIGTVDLLNPNAAPLGAVTTPAVTGATATTPPATALPNEAAQGAAAANTAAVSGAAIAPTITPFPPATPATPGAATAVTEPAAATGTATPATAPAATTATPLATATTTVPGTDAAAVLQRMVSDATARAVRLTDPAFANAAAALYVSAGVFRNLSGPQQQPVTGVGTADTVAVPPPEVTPARPIQPV